MRDYISRTVYEVDRKKISEGGISAILLTLALTRILIMEC